MGNTQLDISICYSISELTFNNKAGCEIADTVFGRCVFANTKSNAMFKEIADS
jgi:hypothetical protein